MSKNRRIDDEFIQQFAREIKLKKKPKVEDREQLFRTNRKRYKRLKVEVKKTNHQWQMDLMDMKSLGQYNSRIRYLLVVIDVYSRFVWVKKLRNKNAVHVFDKFKEIIDQENKLPEIIHSDKGGEFSMIRDKAKNGLFGRIVKCYSNENYEMKSMMVKRLIRTLRMMISNVLYGLYGKIEGRYTNILSKIVERYNNTEHKGINNNTPHDVYYGKVKISRTFKYKRYFEFYPFHKKRKYFERGRKS